MKQEKSETNSSLELRIFQVTGNEMNKNGILYFETPVKDTFHSAFYSEYF